jgi:hypothetical protein
VRRFVVLFLLAVLPLQTSWAAVAHCPPRGSDAAAASAAAHATAHDDGHRHDGASVGHDGHQHDHGTSGHSDAPAPDCSLFQLVAIDPPVAARQSPPSPGAAIAGIEHSGHPSHVPDGIDRPKWRLAA